MLGYANGILGANWDHPNKISAEDAQKILATVREDNNEESEVSNESSCGSQS